MGISTNLKKGKREIDSLKISMQTFSRCINSSKERKFGPGVTSMEHPLTGTRL